MASLEIDLSIRGLNESVRGFGQLSTSLDNNIKLQKQLSDRLTEVSQKMKSGGGDYNKLRQQQQQLRGSVTTLNREIKNQVAVISNNDGSLVQMRARLNNLRLTYDQLSASQRNSSLIQRTLVRDIQQLNNEIGRAEAQTGRFQRNVGNYGSALGTLSPQLSMLAGRAGGFIGVALAARDAYQTVSRFDSGLRDVEKTTGLSRSEIKELGKEFVNLSRSLQTVSTNELTQYATVAGQLGIKGTQNILAFTEALAKLETATNISGEQGGAEIARTLTLIEGGVQNVRKFGDEIVNLGNNFAATESEILSNAQAISQNTGIYNFGRQEVLAYAAATRSLGVEAEVVGSTFQKTLGTFERAIRTGKGLDEILSVVGGTAEDLSSRFRIDASGVFQDYIKGLNDIQKSGGSVMAQMEKNGIQDIRQRRVIATLANGYDTLARSMDTVRDSANALDNEFAVKAGSMAKQTGRMKIAWDNLVLSIESGTGAIGKFSVAFADVTATVLDKLTNVVTSRSWSEFFTRMGEFSGNNAISFSASGMGDVMRMQSEGVGNNNRGLVPYKDLKDFYSLSEKQQKEELIAQERLFKFSVDRYNQEGKTIKLRDEMLYQAEKLAKMRQVVATPDTGMPKTVEDTGKINENVKKTSENTKGLTELNKLLGTQGDYFSDKVLEINQKYNKLAEDIKNSGAEFTKISEALGIVEAQKETDLLINRFEKLFYLSKNLGSGVTSITGSLSTPPSELPRLEETIQRINGGRKTQSNSDNKELEKRLGRVVERGLRRGIDDIFSNITDLGSNFYEVFSGVFGKLADTVTSTFGQVLSTQLGDLLSSRINNKDFSVGGLGSTASKALVAGGGLLGGILSAQGQSKVNSGLMIGGGALSGAAAGSAFGPIGAAAGAVIGAISGIFQSSGAKRQQKLQEEALAEQRKQTKLAERAASLSFSSQITGQQIAGLGIVNSIDRNEFGEMVTRVSGSDLEIVLQRNKDKR